MTFRKHFAKSLVVKIIDKPSLVAVLTAVERNIAPTTPFLQVNNVYIIHLFKIFVKSL